MPLWPHLKLIEGSALAGQIMGLFIWEVNTSLILANLKQQGQRVNPTFEEERAAGATKGNRRELCETLAAPDTDPDAGLDAAMWLSAARRKS